VASRRSPRSLGRVRARLDDDRITERLAEVPAWSRDGDTIVRTVECGSFPAAIAFVVRIGFLAEAQDHHPDVDIRWRTVRLRLSTHDLAGLSDWDFDLATEIDAVAP
jgi:4a-hydroxytetrahydrobiopterin dehydratase